MNVSQRAGMLTRRNICIAGVGLLCAASAPGARTLASTLESISGTLPLKTLGAKKGLVVGTSYSGLGDERDRHLITQQVDLVVPEWVLKPLHLKPEEHAPTRFAQADKIADFGRDKGLAMHGHTLYWYADRFSWADHSDFLTASGKYGRFVDEVVKRYSDFVSWDVFNEIVDDRGPGLLRPDYLMRRHGVEFVEVLFKRVHELAPHATLVLNDNRFQCSSRMCRDRQHRALRLIDKLLERGTPIHAFGIQSHLSSRDGLDLDNLTDFMDQLAQRGLAIYLSELDVNDVDFADDLIERDKQVADMYFRYLSSVLRNSAVKRMAFWGLSDRDHWLVRTRAHPGRPVGQGRPAPFDAELAPKPAFYAIADALAIAPARA